VELELIKTDSANSDFIELVKQLDIELNERYGELQKQYNEHNKIDYIKNVITIYKDKVPAACGAFKEYDSSSVELKRIFVSKEYRKQGLAKLVVKALEELAKEAGYKYAVLETGIKQPEAINLYKSLGYEVAPSYRPYIGNSNSICMKKELY